MLELPHTIIGAAIATRIGNPALALPLALASHILLDLIPHWNPSLFTETSKNGRPSSKTTLLVVGDVILSLIAGGWLAFRFWPNIDRVIVVLLACFLAVSWDVIEGFYFFMGYRNRFLERLIGFQVKIQSRAPKLTGLLTQAIVILVGLYFIFAK